jgi:P-type E1-E2 ATPase
MMVSADWTCPMHPQIRRDGPGAQAGVLAKNAEALQGFDQVDTLLIDKTGTLTEGKPKLVEIETVGKVAEPDLLMSPMFAGAAMALSSLTVVTNALRLNNVRL